MVVINYNFEFNDKIINIMKLMGVCFLDGWLGCVMLYNVNILLY